MNNLNDPPRWNIRPDNRGREAGAGDGNPWNYALLVPMLGLAAFRWIWTKESQQEIQRVKDECNKDVSTVKSELEARYQETLTERRRTGRHVGAGAGEGEAESGRLQAGICVTEPTACSRTKTAAAGARCIE
ncbi:Coiled-coil domain-containing protein 127 [Oryzias melastigma]|uniref:Coiled-coil domain-containing protein 127 n=1 Tax=Oryzias melastigma TaxID=30732 RepID=A0A834F016_ORYME|nr:Coiled-coil domain-containing protein 127 [Oryzias melastigma]